MHTFWRKYQQVMAISWEGGFIYRLNFIMWRVRTLLQLLSVYFLWKAVLITSPNSFSYPPEALLTYVIGTSLIRAVVFASQSTTVQNDIGNGDLNNYLIKPINYFGYWFARDLADKFLNLLFSVGEIGLIYLILRPPLVGPPSGGHLTIFIIAVILAMFLYFYFSLIISLTVFWMPEGNGWPQRFFVFVMLEFLSGGLFPLEILPPPLYQAVRYLPTSYFLNTPLQIYLGRLTTLEMGQSIIIAGLWLLLFKLLADHLFNRGVKVYGAYGR